jgi:hypothetical protein
MVTVVTMVARPTVLSMTTVGGLVARSLGSGLGVFAVARPHPGAVLVVIVVHAAAPLSDLSSKDAGADRGRAVPEPVLAN